MSYKDFVGNYQKLEICYLGPDSLALEEEKQGKRKFEGKLFEGSWRPRVNAGGCRNYPGNIYVYVYVHFRQILSSSDDFIDPGLNSIIVDLIWHHDMRLSDR